MENASNMKMQTLFDYTELADGEREDKEEKISSTQKYRSLKPENFNVIKRKFKGMTRNYSRYNPKNVQ